MTEQYPSNAELEALSGTTDAPTGLYYIPKGEGLDWYASFIKSLRQVAVNLYPLAGLRVYKDGDLTFGVQGGTYWCGGQQHQYAGQSQTSLTDEATNYIYLVAGQGSVTVNTTGFPDPAEVAHLRLASIITSNGAYEVADVTDHRGQHVLAAGSALAWGAAEVLIPQVSLVVGAESGNAIDVTVQVQDCQGNDNANRFLLHAWLSDSPYGAETASAPDSTSFTTGTVLEQITAGKRWSVLTDVSGRAVLSVGEDGDVQWYLNVEINGRVYCSDAIDFNV